MEVHRKVQAVVTPGGSVKVLAPGERGGGWDSEAAPSLQRPPRGRRRQGSAHEDDSGAAAAKAAQRRRRGRADLRSNDFVVGQEQRGGALSQGQNQGDAVQPQG